MIIDYYPEMPNFDETKRRAPRRGFNLNEAETKLALKNALRYVSSELHEKLAPEFLAELKEYGRIYAYRYRPAGAIVGKPIEEYEGKCVEGKAFQVMMDNNLSFDIALYPYELITYGETGAVALNWLQYTLIKHYLEQLTEDYTLVIQSGHPLGLFPSHKNSPRLLITNGLMVGLYSNLEDFERASQLGVANYGQMTAGGLMYIGPQGIVHGTYNTVLNIARLKLRAKDGLAGRIFISSGLGGMSGAQPKAVTIAGGVAIIAEVDYSRIKQRQEQGWVGFESTSLDEIFIKARDYALLHDPVSIAYHGNVVDLLEYAVIHNIHIDLITDQTSCHNVYEGGYLPVSLGQKQMSNLLNTNKEKLKEEVHTSLKRHYSAIKKLVERGSYFFDYGNSFLKAVYDAGEIEVAKDGDAKNGFVFPSYVEDVMGPELFDRGYGPFRWVCLSGKDEDLKKTDEAALEILKSKENKNKFDLDNQKWLEDAEKNNLVVGTKARILYQDEMGRVNIALKFNELVRKGEIGPIMLGRDHHDVSGTDSPFRETANIKDGSNIMADMATQTALGGAARGMSLVALHNGGGVGIGKSINGGFGLVLDGTPLKDEIIKQAISFDVLNGIARRAWAGNENSIEVINEYNRSGKGSVTIPQIADENLLNKTLQGDI
ncbi:MAG: urocanate hydratase [Defluviitaleaceae bacterium]|nr:urocanate hydratase [Defluviitaleaceae bacterium]